MEPQIKALVESVGLLNVPLRHNQQTGVPLYALLNGSTNNVCAGVNTECTVIDFQQMAWSSGCNYFLHFMRNRCNVIRFDTTRVESYEETPSMWAAFQPMLSPPSSPRTSVGKWI